MYFCAKRETPPISDEVFPLFVTDAEVGRSEFGEMGDFGTLGPGFNSMLSATPLAFLDKAKRDGKPVLDQSRVHMLSSLSKDFRARGVRMVGALSANVFSF